MVSKWYTELIKKRRNFSIYRGDYGEGTDLGVKWGAQKSVWMDGYGESWTGTWRVVIWWNYSWHQGVVYS